MRVVEAKPIRKRISRVIIIYSNLDIETEIVFTDTRNYNLDNIIDKLEVDKDE